jgi:hypothetical protein
MLPCDAARRDFASWDAHLDAAIEILKTSDGNDPDLAWAANVAGDLALDAGEHERARAVYEVALAQYRALGRAEETARLEQRIASL